MKLHVLFGLIVLALAAAGPDVAIDSGPASATAACADDAGQVWVAAAAGPRLRVFRSQDYGATWERRFELRTGAGVSRAEMFFAAGESSFLYLFFLTDADAGDLWLARFAPDSTAPELLPVATGPDTVTDFSVAADSGRHYYLYCLYANELRVGQNGGFTRSLNSGRTWELPQQWWNCADPHVACGKGSTIHCAWRYAANGREIHYERNRYYGAARRWDNHIDLTGKDRWCWEPVVCCADTGDEWNNPVRVAWTLGQRDSSRTEVFVAYSPDGGSNWQAGGQFGDAWQDEWAPDLAAFPGSASGYCYLAFDKGGRDQTAVHWTGANASEPDRWFKPRNVADRRANARADACRPRLVCVPGAPRQWPGVVFTGYADDGAAGVYFDAPWLPGGAGPGPVRHEPGAVSGGPHRASFLSGRPFRLAPGVAGNYRVTIYDPLGRAVRTLYDGWLPAAGRELTWDGTDAAGRAAGSGTYVVVARGPAPVTERITVAR